MGSTYARAKGGWEREEMGRAATRSQADATAIDVAVDVLTLDTTSLHVATLLQSTAFTEAEG